jgi:hypothetical protein
MPGKIEVLPGKIEAEKLAAAKSENQTLFLEIVRRMPNSP